MINLPFASMACIGNQGSRRNRRSRRNHPVLQTTLIKLETVRKFYEEKILKGLH